MKKVFCVMMGVCALLNPCPADEAGMQRVLSMWNAQYSDWEAAFKTADSDTKRAELLKSMPDGADVAAALWREVHKDLDKPYVVPGVTWLMNHSEDIAKAYPQQDKARKIMLACMKAMENDLLLFKGAGQAAFALSQSNNARCRTILERMKNFNQNPEDQGLAALGLAMSMKETAGMKQDDRRLIQARSKLLKDVIIKSCHCKFGPYAVEDIIKEELYEMNNLTVGITAPTVKLKNTTGTEVTVPSGKYPTLLVFWNPNHDRSVRFLEKAASLRAQFPDLTVMPVAAATNATDVSSALLNLNLNLDSLVDDKAKAFKDFRIATLPQVYLIDPKGRILLRGIPDMIFDVKLGAEMKKFAVAQTKTAPKQQPVVAPMPEREIDSPDTRVPARPYKPTPTPAPKLLPAPIIVTDDLVAPPLREMPE